MEMPRFSFELLVAQRVIGGIHEKRERHLEGLNHLVRIDLEGDGCGPGRPGEEVGDKPVKC